MQSGLLCLNGETIPASQFGYTTYMQNHRWKTLHFAIHNPARGSNFFNRAPCLCQRSKHWALRESDQWSLATNPGKTSAMKKYICPLVVLREDKVFIIILDINYTKENPGIWDA